MNGHHTPKIAEVTMVCMLGYGFLSHYPAAPLVGRTVAHYFIAERIGGGGMGVVYLARDTKLGRAVALKFLPPQWCQDEGAKQRFLREAQAASATNHRNICIIHDIEETDDGQLFIVMAYYEGQTLKQRLEQGALPAAEAIDIAAEVAEGLAKAHAQGVVHRDIKPGNIMLTDDGVKILDFGLAKLADSALKLTLEGSTLGTIAYMSPEQARGDEADERSDVWSLGVVLYEMLAGELPFKGGYPEAIAYAIKHEPPPPLSDATEDIPESLARIVERALRKDPEARYQAARDMARELRYLQGRSLPVDLRTEPVRVDSREQRLENEEQRAGDLRTARKRKRQILGYAAAAIALITVTAAVYLWMAQPIARIPIAVVPVANHTGEPQVDDYRRALTQELIAELNNSPNVRVVPYLRLLELLRPFAEGDVSGSEAIHAISTQGGARFVVVPSFRSREGKWLAQIDVQNVDTGTSVAQYETDTVASSLPKEAAYGLVLAAAGRVDEHFRNSSGGKAYVPRDTAQRFQTLDAAQSYEAGLNAYEEQEYGAALIALERAASQDRQHAMTHAWLSRVLVILERGAEAVEAAQRALQLAGTAATPSDTLFIEAVVADSRRDLTVAEERYRRFRESRPDDPGAYTELADFLRRREISQRAVDAYHETLRIDPQYLRPHVDLCQLYTRLDDHPRAEREAQTALDGYRAAKNRSGEAQALLCLGEAQREQGGARLEDAKRNAERAREILTSLSQPYNLARAVQYQALVEYAGGFLDRAARLFEDALAQARSAGNRRIESIALMNLGVTYQEMGERARAVDYYRQSRDLFEASGNDRRAAEQDIEVANLVVNFGVDRADALRRLRSARATVVKFGYSDYQVEAERIEAAAERHGGRLAEARRRLLAALTVAKEKKLARHTTVLTVDVANVDLLLGNYASARSALEELTKAQPAAGADVRIALARSLVAIGDFQAASPHLDAVRQNIESGTHPELNPSAPRTYATLGELAYESGNPDEARKFFERAANLWTDAFPDPASVQARCYAGFLAASAGGRAASEKALSSGLEQARKMGQLDIEARCALLQARVHLRDGRYAEVLAALKDLPPAEGRSIDPELEAQIRDCRGRALAASGNAGAAAVERESALALVKKLQASIPTPDAAMFASKTSIRDMLRAADVRDGL